MDIKQRMKNPYFWVGLVALFLSTTQIVPADLTSWAILQVKLLAVLSNPYLVGTFIVAFIGYLIDNKTKGLKD